jgi:hypothetical protein
MRTVSRLKYIDQIGISSLGIFLILSFVFRVSPASIMNPGFPILRKSVLNFSIVGMPYWFEVPQRTTSVYDFSKVSYESLFLLSDNSQADTSFSVKHDVTRFSNSAEAMATLQANYESYSNETLYRLITSIPNLDFTSRANSYYLWCEQPKREESTSYVGESISTCYYWAVYGRYYSELRVNMWPIVGSGRHFSIEIFNDYLFRADRKLSIAQWWFNDETP